MENPFVRVQVHVQDLKGVKKFYEELFDRKPDMNPTIIDVEAKNVGCKKGLTRLNGWRARSWR